MSGGRTTRSLSPSVTVPASVRSLAGRISWGMADQAVSSLTNFAVGIIVAKHCRCDHAARAGDSEAIVTANPRLSVALPVYNGQNFLAEALDALLHQTFDDFELIISDNASTDATEDICRRYAAADARIRYIRQPVNVGAARNHDIVLQEARGELFKWASHDDLYGAELLAKCVAVLDERPNVVLCHASMAYVDPAGEILYLYDYTMATDSPSAPERFRSLLFTDGGDDEYGVMRTEVLRQVHPADSYHNPGRTLVAEIALHGAFHQVPDLLYFRRDHPARGDRNPTIRAVCTNLDPQRADHSTLRLVAEYIRGYHRAIRDAPISPADRRACYRHLVHWLTTRSFLESVHWIERMVPTLGPAVHAGASRYPEYGSSAAKLARGSWWSSRNARIGRHEEDIERGT